MINRSAYTKFIQKSPGSKLCLLVILVCLLVPFASSARGGEILRNVSTPSPSGDQNKVVVSLSADDHEKHYHISSGDCSITWSIRATERDIIKHSAICDKPLSLQIPLLITIGEELFAGENDFEARKVFWGTLQNGRKTVDNEMSFRLALAAAKSPRWDANSGKPKKGDLYGFVKDLANQEIIYQELQCVFAHFDRSVTLAAIEKVRILEAEKLPFYDRLKSHGVRPKEKLPFDFMAWFSISDNFEKR